MLSAHHYRTHLFILKVVRNHVCIYVVYTAPRVCTLYICVCVCALLQAQSPTLTHREQWSSVSPHTIQSQSYTFWNTISIETVVVTYSSVSVVCVVFFSFASPSLCVRSVALCIRKSHHIASHMSVCVSACVLTSNFCLLLNFQPVQHTRPSINSWTIDVLE